MGATERIAAPIVVISALLFAAASVLFAVQRVVQLAHGEADLEFALLLRGVPDVPGSASANFSAVTVSSAAVSFWPVFWIAVGAILIAVVQLVVGLVVFRFAHEVSRGRPFPTWVPRALIAAAVVVAIVGTASAVFDNWGLATARAELVEKGLDALGGGQPAWSPWPTIAVAVFFSVLALVFRSGERLQRDTEGLV